MIRNKVILNNGSHFKSANKMLYDTVIDLKKMKINVRYWYSFFLEYSSSGFNTFYGFFFIQVVIIQTICIKTVKVNHLKIN